MTQHNVGALVVVKPGAGEHKSIAGIITERGNIIENYIFEWKLKIMCLCARFDDFMTLYFSRLSEENHCPRKVIQVDQSWGYHD